MSDAEGMLMIISPGVLSRVLTRAFASLLPWHKTLSATLAVPARPEGLLAPTDLFSWMDVTSGDGRREERGQNTT